MNQELFNLIESLKKETDNTKLENITIFKEYFKEFFKKYPARDLFKVSKMTYEESLTSLFLVQNPYKTQEVLNIIAIYSELFADINLSDFLRSIAIYYNNLEYKRLIDEVIDTNNPFILMKKTHNLLIYCNNNDFDYEVVIETIKYLKANNARKNLEIVFKGLNSELVDQMINFSITTIALKEILNEREHTRTQLEKAFKYLLSKENKDVLVIINYYNLLFGKYEETLRTINIEVKEINRNNKKLDDLIKMLDKDDEINNIDDILKLCPNNNIKSLVVNYILKHNKKVYLELIAKYENFQQNSDESLSVLFAKYNYDYFLLNINERNIIKQVGYENLDLVLEFLYKNQINLEINYIYLISIDKISYVQDLINKGVLTSEFVNKNIELIYMTSNLLDIVLYNIEILNKHNINIKNYVDSLDILLNTSLEDSLNILSLYGLNITRETTSILFLNNSNLQDKIDLLIMMGLYDNLITLDILNKSLDELIKQKIFTSLNIEFANLDIYQKEEYLFTGSNYLIPEDILKIFNDNASSQIELPEELLLYKINNYVLFINGIYVSVKKLLRNLGKFKDINMEIILYSMIYDSYYSLEEIEALSEILIPSQDFYSLVRSI